VLAALAVAGPAMAQTAPPLPRETMGLDPKYDVVMMTFDVVGDELGRAREGGALTHAQQEAQHEDHGEPAGETGQEGRQRPDREADRQGPVGVDLLGHPAGQHLAGDVGPEERRGEQADLGAGEAELVLE